MLYKRNNGKKLNMTLFENPTAEYRGAPFWAWNCRLDGGTVLSQINYFKEMGFGGFHIHSRTGMATEYLGDEFMGHVKACVEKAKREDMLVWLYDEDRFASGFAGGYLTREKTYRQKSLCFTKEQKQSLTDKSTAFETGTPYLLAEYDVGIDPQSGLLTDYRRLAAGETAAEHWYAYVLTAENDPWFNNQAYADVMDMETMSRFIEITYEAYDKAVGDAFGDTVPAIFTDEPHFRLAGVPYTRASATDGAELKTAWSRFFEEKYEKRYGESLVDRLPELFWLTADGRDSEVKYRYYDACAAFFCDATVKQCDDWCKRHGIALTGHMLHEQTLELQVGGNGDIMRQYRHMTMPGIDILHNRVELATAKQCQSIVRQYGKEAMLAELYGVTNWDFDFAGHKFGGDWLAACGVTVRVPHLSWMSMEGEAKRDFPASIFYQSPWYRQYKYVEDHYARLNTVLTRGKPLVRVGVIHPMESFWLACGPDDRTGDDRARMDEQFAQTMEWLLSEHYDFDFIDEYLLPECSDAAHAKRFGDMEYDCIVLPDCRALRSTTVTHLEAFLAQGGRLVFMGDCPTYIDGKQSGGAKDLFAKAMTIPFDKTALSAALSPVRTVDIRTAAGESAADYLYQWRQDDDVNWLYVARFVQAAHAEELSVRVKGNFTAEIYDTVNGKASPAVVRWENGETVISCRLYASDSLLLRLIAGKVPPQTHSVRRETEWSAVVIPQRVLVEREEPNVLLLDQAEYRVDGGEWHPREEILRIDTCLRKRFGYPLRVERLAQPWTVDKKAPKHRLSLRFTVQSDVTVQNAKLALEDALQTTVTFNGMLLDTTPTGWYVDKSIQTIALPTIPKGSSTLELEFAFSPTANPESCYLLGDFSVAVDGRDCRLTPRSETVPFVSLTECGMPFYGGNLTYHIPLDVDVDGDVEVALGRFVGATAEISLDDGTPHMTAFAPHTAVFTAVPSGKHTVKIKVYGNRFNTFGCLHNFADHIRWCGPDAWRPAETDWRYDYKLRETGLLEAPVVRINNMSKQEEIL